MEKQQDTIESNGRGAPIGNKNAAKGAQLTSMLEFALNQNDKALLRDGITKVAEAFALGERWAIEFVFDRFEGKAVTKTELSGPDGSTMPVSIALEFVNGTVSE